MSRDITIAETGGFEPPTHGLGNDVRMRRCADCAANSMTIPLRHRCAAAPNAPPLWNARRFGRRLEHVFDYLTLLCEMACFE